MTPEGRTPSPQGSQSEVADELRQDAGHLKESLGARAKQEAESRKGQAAQVAGSASSALDTAARDLRDNPEAPEWMASALQQAARRIESLASHVDGRNIDELGDEVAEFARRNPGTFLAASAAAGFAAARVLRAGVDKKRHERSGDQYGSGNGNDLRSAQDWPADENIRPTEAGGYAPAYGGGGTGGDFGGTAR